MFAFGSCVGDLGEHPARLFYYRGQGRLKLHEARGGFQAINWRRMNEVLSDLLDTDRGTQGFRIHVASEPRWRLRSTFLSPTDLGTTSGIASTRRPLHLAYPRLFIHEQRDGPPYLVLGPGEAAS